MAVVFTTTLTQAEIFYRLTLLPEGRRRDNLLAAGTALYMFERRVKKIAKTLHILAMC